MINLQSVKKDSTILTRIISNSSRYSIINRSSGSINRIIKMCSMPSRKYTALTPRRQFLRTVNRRFKASMLSYKNNRRPAIFLPYSYRLTMRVSILRQDRLWPTRPIPCFRNP